MNEEQILAASERVCHAVYGRYPADPRIRKEVETLERYGYSIDVLCLREAGGPKVEMKGRIRVFHLPLDAIRGTRFRYVFQYSLFFLLVATKLTVGAARYRYGVIHLHSLPDFLVFAAMPARLFGSRVVLDLHESMPRLYLARFGDPPGSWVHRLTVAAERVSCKVADRVITVNPVLAELLRDNGVPSSKVEVVENSPDWQTVPGPDSTVIDQQGGPPEIVIAGGLNDERDLLRVVTAIGLVCRSHEIRLRLIGRGERPYLERLARTVQELGLDKQVILEDEVAQAFIPQLLRNSVLGIVSYRRNPLTEVATPNKAYEYATLGKPIVAADLPGLRRLFGDAAVYYAPEDPSSLASKVLEVLENPVLRAKLSWCARAVSREHRWEIMAERLAAIYEQLSGKNPKRYGANLP